MAKDKYVVIQGWMLDYDLSSRELLVYAIIHGFSQDEESFFYGSRQYLADWTKSSLSQVQRILNNLVEKKYLLKKEKFENNVKYCYYKTLRPQCHSESGRFTMTHPSCHYDTGQSHSESASSVMVSHNNKYIINLKERENKEDSLSFNSEYVKELYEKWVSYGFLNRGYLEFLNRFPQAQSYLKGIHSRDVFRAIDNYKSVRDSNGWYAKNHNFTFEAFCRNINSFLEGNFDIRNFCDSKDLQKIEEGKENEDDLILSECPICNKRKLQWIVEAQHFKCRACQKVLTWEQVNG